MYGVAAAWMQRPMRRCEIRDGAQTDDTSASLGGQKDNDIHERPEEWLDVRASPDPMQCVT
jgi:hypothetical protein